MTPTTPGRTPRAASALVGGDDFVVGDLVDVPGNMYGTVRFIGPVQGKKGTFAGVELHSDFAPRGKNSGDVDGTATDFELAMRSIKAKMLVLPGQTDLYFPPEDSEYEVKCMSPGIGTCVAFPSIWGHWAGGPGQSTEDVKWLDAKLRVFFGD
ncbi:hypothetical protein BN1708_017154, partial [Verticillium longisporum]